MKFTKEHEWVNIKGEVAFVGISDYAQKALGDIVSLDLPKVGSTVKQGQSLGVVDSMKASSEIYSPLSGEVLEVNNELDANPQWVNESPQEKGWMAKLKPTNVSELDGLMSEEEYKKYLEGLSK
ncbi:MAG: glycine cleavage system protein GcvH [Candidatus Micrarchaeota archaeon]